MCKLRVHDFSDGSLATSALQRQLRTYRNDSWWHSAPCTQHAASDIFRLTARSAGMLYANVLLRFSGYPYRLAEMVRPGDAQDEARRAFLDARPCMLDVFSLELRNDFPTMEALRSDECQVMIRCALEALDMSTFSTERLHSQNARRIISRNMTHPLRMEQAGMFHAGMAAPEFAQEVHGIELAVAKRPASFPVASENAAKKRRGGGGAFRAFLHLRSQTDAPGHRTQFKNKREEYRNLDADTKRQCVELGRQATALHQRGLPSFPKTYTAGRKHQQDQQRAADIQRKGDIIAGDPGCSCPGKRHGDIVSALVVQRCLEACKYSEEYLFANCSAGKCSTKYTM
eukprot:6492784-Amphidinium_carterae.3